MYRYLVQSVRQHAKEHGIKAAVLGMSGGIDSSLLACIAHDALGKANVIGVSMPSKYSPAHGKEDAQLAAKALGIRFVTHPIQPIVDMNKKMYRALFGGFRRPETERHVQCRERAKILMEVANEHQGMVLLPGNKSDLATGHHLLYSDVIGGIAVLDEVTKSEIYRLARHRNALKRVIPERVFRKAPSMELAYGQRDTDDAPPFHLLDPVLKLHVDRRKSLSDIIAAGHDKGLAKKVLDLVRRHARRR
jgi:NAD+ synthase (glutamine-hydrolysing)